MGNKEDLQDLFRVWYQEQKAIDMNGVLGKNVKKRGISLDSFCVDGVINDKVYWDNNKKDKRILFILREENGSHVTAKDEEDNIIIGEGPERENFWVKDQFRECGDNNKRDARLPVMLKKLINVRLLIDAVDTKKGLNEESTCAELMETTAFMNINKMGGYSSVHWPTLIAYAEEFSAQIKKEIEILSPDIVVCCGTYWLLKEKVLTKDKWEESDREFVSYLTLNDKAMKVYDLPHTARRGIKVMEYGRQEIISENNADHDTENQEIDTIKKKIKDYIDSADNNPEVLFEIYDMIEN